MPKGQLTQQQIVFTELVAGGVGEEEAVLRAGFKKEHIRQNLYRLRKNKRVQDRIKLLKDGSKTGEIMTDTDIRVFWSQIIRDPKASVNQKIEASKLLGRSLSMFVEKKEVSTNVKHQSVMIIPDIDNWEQYWEDNN